VDDYANVPTYSGIGGANARTASLWVKTSASGVYQALVQWGADATGQLWMLRVLADGTVTVAAYGGGVYSTQTITDGQWHHIAAVLDEGQTDSGQIRLYVDGVLDSTSYSDHCTIATAQSASVHLGVWYKYTTSTRTNYFTGLMDEVRIYERALSAAEVAALAND
jgi:hypothetical protein